MRNKLIFSLVIGVLTGAVATSPVRAAANFEYQGLPDPRRVFDFLKGRFEGMVDLLPEERAAAHQALVILSPDNQDPYIGELLKVPEQLAEIESRQAEKMPDNIRSTIAKSQYLIGRLTGQQENLNLTSLNYGLDN